MIWFSPVLALFVFALMGLRAEEPTLQQLDVASESSVWSIDRDLVASLDKFKNFVDDTDRFTAKTCVSSIEPISREAMELRPEMFRDVNFKTDHKPLVERSFALRLSLMNRLRDFYNDGTLKTGEEPCVISVRRALRYLRHFEDYVLVTALDPKEFNAKKDPKAGKVLQGMGPELLTPDGDKTLKIRSGDVLLSRGFAYTSAAIARIGIEEGQFSHLAQIYIDAPIGTELTVAQALKDKRVRMIEAHIEIGSFTRDFAGYVSDGNSRVLLFRPRVDAKVAHTAAKTIWTHVIRHQEAQRKKAGRTKTEVNDNPPYDFKMDNEDSAQIFCSEIITIGYKKAGVSLPSFATRLRRNGMTRRMEIDVVRSFAPADMEIEPQFELLGEWRDLRKIPSVMRKDAVLSAMFKWMDIRNYDFIWNLPDAVKARIAWTARQLDLGFSERLPKNMNRDIIAMTFVLERVAARLEDELISLQSEKLKAGKMRPNFPEQIQRLEHFRAEDDKRFKEDKNPAIHGHFRKLASKPK